MLVKRFIQLSLLLLFCGYSMDALAQNLYDFIKHNSPVVCSHRAIPYPSVAENSLQGIVESHQKGIVLHEIDIRESADGQLIVMHDNTIDRTSNGSGLVCNFTAEQLTAILLKNSTETIPSFNDFLNYAKENNLFLMLDLKGVEVEKVIKQVIAQQMIDNVLVLTFSREDALEAFSLELPFVVSVLIEEIDDYSWYKKMAPSSVNWFAYLNQSAPESLFNFLDQEKIMVISDTMGLLDKQAEKYGISQYTNFINSRNIDIIVSDFPAKVLQSLKNSQIRH